MRRVAVFLLLVPAAVAAGCTRNSANTTPARSTPAMSTSTTSGRTITASGTFVAYTPGATAVTYDPALVPVGATATATITQTCTPTVAVRPVIPRAPTTSTNSTPPHPRPGPR